MKASLQLKMGQQLTMTPQLQQAIRLLQLSTLDLQQEIQEALDSNPMLEIEDQDSSDSDTQNSNDDTIESKLNQSQESSQKNKDEDFDPAAAELDDQHTFESKHDLEDDGDWSEGNQSQSNEYEANDHWEESFSTPAAASTPVSKGSNEDYDFEANNSAVESLQDHLLWQLNLTPFSDTDHIIALAIIDGVDDSGYLQVSLDDVLESLDPSLEVELDEVEAVLKRLQQFEPAGILARNLQECLLLQLNQNHQDHPLYNKGLKVVRDHMELLGNRDYAGLMRKTKLKEHELKDVLGLITSLTPRPGAQISPKHAEYIVPDVFVKKVKGIWQVELNPDIAPKLRINDQYAGLVKRADQSDENTFLKDNLQEARWFLKSLQSRNETLLKVATKIVEYQQEFLDKGEEAMKPLVLHDIAEAVGMHESTISRVTTQKFMYTPRGIFELKYFFSSHVSTATGGECSSTAIRAMIKKLISAETPKKPLSDSKIANLLGEQGIQVARRTVAKYREAMAIPPSNERKRLV